jgi:hypothetical protein
MVINARKHNENTIKDVTLFPNQNAICNNHVQARFCMKLDMFNAYEQIHMKESDVPKMAFETICGTFVSCIMQQGNCNVHSTLQKSCFMNTLGGLSMFT